MILEGLCKGFAYLTLEHIIIDGWITDGDMEIIKKIGQSLSYWIIETDIIQSNALNKDCQSNKQYLSLDAFWSLFWA